MLVADVHTPLHNFTPIGAMAIFGGCYFDRKWKALFVPLATLWLTDLLMNYFIYFHKWTWFYDGFLWTYGSFSLMVVLGMAIHKVNIKTVFFAGISAALLHWIITDFGVWLGGGMDITTRLPYTKDITGFLKCYVLAIAYLKNMAIGNMVFGSIMFGAFELAQKRFPSLTLSHSDL